MTGAAARRKTRRPCAGRAAGPAGTPEQSKLPLPRLPGSRADAALPEELKVAWTEHMVNGFKQNEQMFARTLEAFMTPYRLTVRLYVALVCVGIGLFVLAAVIGLRGGDSVAAVAFAGLGVAAFLAFFVRQPLRALEENLECITWLGVAFNTYWARLMYMTDPGTVQAELKAAEADFRASVERLIGQHAALRGKRPGGDLNAEGAAMAAKAKWTVLTYIAAHNDLDRFGKAEPDGDPRRRQHARGGAGRALRRRGRERGAT